MRDNLIKEVSRKSKIQDHSRLEKDIILHEIISELSKNEYFTENYIFKGGTCLVKTYLGYYRFSEDLDFTWKNQDIFEGKSQSEINRQASNEANNLGSLVEKITQKLSLDFKFEKKNTEYFWFGSGGKILTLFVWYNSEITQEKSMIKLQFNFLEKIQYGFELRELSSLAPDDQSIKYTFDNHPYFEKIRFSAYKPEEILCEKIRAILTRQTVKARDFLDIYLVCKKYEISISEILENAILKVEFALEMYQKYRDNIEEKLKLLELGELFDWGEEKNLLLEEIDDVDFNLFEKELEKNLKEIILKLQKK